VVVTEGQTTTIHYGKTKIIAGLKALLMAEKAQVSDTRPCRYGLATMPN
jgi:hypothetical protein